ncbi:hypothetical protein NPIL_278731 [Nephila pilipes]|uniref:Uncharacterized protein n=1 Tax=Nephila pilipes TaxID=299642 RepID=A0A8X6QJ14_NEPPI|nr:hypothetical protein NPIL_278731 [Nephila pilipes]
MNVNDYILTEEDARILYNILQTDAFLNENQGNYIPITSPISNPSNIDDDFNAIQPLNLSVRSNSRLNLVNNRPLLNGRSRSRSNGRSRSRSRSNGRLRSRSRSNGRLRSRSRSDSRSNTRSDSRSSNRVPNRIRNQPRRVRSKYKIKVIPNRVCRHLLSRAKKHKTTRDDKSYKATLKINRRG